MANYFKTPAASRETKEAKITEIPERMQQIEQALELSYATNKRLKESLEHVFQ